MNFIVGGGVHEHGRNCFYVEADINYIVDCGIMRGAEKPYPRLTPEQIKSAKYLFLTHMHEDHIGAFGWLVKNGFCGLVVASEETLAALPAYEKKLALPQAFGKVNIGTVGIEYGSAAITANIPVSTSIKSKGRVPNLPFWTARSGICRTTGRRRKKRLSLSPEKR